MTDNSGPALLTLLPERKVNWSSLGLSFGAQAIALAVLVHVGLVQPQKLVPKKVSYSITALMPQSAPPQRAAVHPTRQMLPRAEAPRVVARLTAPRRVLEAQERAPELAVRQAMPKTDLVAPPPRMPEKLAIVQTGVFGSTGSQAVPTLAKAARDVQTGGFGDPNGVPINPNGKGRGPANIAQLGSFDLPSGPGQGNGTGGARGARGTVASVGFGNGVAIGNSDHNNAGAARGAIQQSGFGDARGVAEAHPRPRTVEQAPVFTPVQVLSKPSPTYTDEARKKRLEGEVLLEVAFGAGGDVHVMRVLRGLGYGLDEAAIHAAQQIRFRPATRNGQPVDSVASLHVVFQLAY